MIKSGWKGLSLSVLGGASLVLAFAPFKLWVAAPFSLAVLFLLIHHAKPATAGFRGFAFGLGLYGVGVSWVYVSLSTFGGMPFWMGSIAVLGFASLLASFISVMAWAVARSFPAGHVGRLLLLPCAWVIFEWLKSWVLTGFPWLDVGYAFVETWLSGWAPIGGIYLVSFVIVVVASLLAWTMLTRRWTGMLLGSALVLISWPLSSVHWTQSAGLPITVGVIQANVPINEKWQRNRRQAVVDNYRDMSVQMRQSRDVELIVLPETALPVHFQYLDSSFWPSLLPKNMALLTGLVDTPSLLAEQPGYQESYNAAVLVCNQTSSPQMYRKRHLVPFGEYLPLRFLFQWVLDYLELPMSDFSAWQGVQPLQCGDRIKIGLSICYEDAFANEYRQTLGDATMLVNIGEDAWFGDSFAPHQRLQMAQMRARELSRPMVRSANSGPSAVIDHWGQVLVSSPQFEAATVIYDVEAQAGLTLFARFGNWIVYCLILLWACVILRARYHSRGS